MCQAFTTTPDVALRLLDRRHRDWTFAVLEAARADKLVDVFNAMGRGEKWARDAWARMTPDDMTFFRELNAGHDADVPAADDAQGVAF